MTPDCCLLHQHHCVSGGFTSRCGRPHFHALRGPLKEKLDSMADDDEPSPAPQDERRDDDDFSPATSADWLRLALAPPPLNLPSPAAAAAGSSGGPERMRIPSVSSSPAMFSPFPAVWPGNSASGFPIPPPVDMAAPLVPWVGPHRREPPPQYWGRFWNVGNANLALGGGSALMLPPAMPEFVARQLVHPTASSAVAPPLPVRVVSPPRRPQSGVWFTLQAMRNHGREPFLPQIPKSYLRIKDGRMTVRLLIKYLVNKLVLEDESEVEITCRGQTLLPSLSLLHVRDHLWRSRESPSATLLQDSINPDHIMMLHYGRRRPSSCMI
ncbi:protein LAX PANICLE 2-like [Zingiber officinale]|uniref:protein LAX PANICLE 2-like n=1 Tax=Zingiber officinale TaxID=94328 RepID=UPI001C4B619D|nr:protein LAX PANICLE 2-like [Zingiber officinale]